MATHSHKIMSSTAEGFLAEDGTIHWRPGPVDDRREETVMAAMKYPVGTRFKLTEVHTLHACDQPASAKMGVDESEEPASMEERENDGQ